MTEQPEDLMDDIDIAILDAIRRLMAEADPVPPHLIADIDFSLSLAAMNAELAALTTEAAAVRAHGPENAESVTFTSSTMTLMVVIGRDGRVAALRQVLTPANFANVETGWDRAQVRRLLGLPAKTQRYELRREEVWDWRFSDDAENKLFSVTFDIDGRVTATATTIDPKEMGGR